MAESHDSALLSLHIPTSPLDALPQQTYSNSQTLQANAEAVTPQSFEPPHTDDDVDERISAQDKFLDAVGFEKEPFNDGAGAIFGWPFGCHSFRLPKGMTGTTGPELAASAVTGSVPRNEMNYSLSGRFGRVFGVNKCDGDVTPTDSRSLRRRKALRCSSRLSAGSNPSQKDLRSRAETQFSNRDLDSTTPACLA